MTDPNTTPPNKSDQAPKSPEELIAHRDKVFSIKEFPKDQIKESFPVQRGGKDGPIEGGWLLVGKGVTPDGLYEVGKFSSIETTIVNGEEREREIVKHLKMDEQIALRDQVEREKTEEVQEHPLAKEMGEDAVRRLVDEPITPTVDQIADNAPSEADAIRQRLKAAVDKPQAEKPVEREPLLGQEDSQLLGAFINKSHDMSEMFTDGNMSKQEIDVQKNRFIGGTIADMTEKLKGGTLSAEAYAFISGTLMGMAGDGSMLQSIAQEMFNSGKFTQEDMNHIHDQFHMIDTIAHMPAAEADEARSSYLFNLEQTAYQTYDANGMKPSNTYIALTGMIAGLSMQFKSGDYRHSYIPKTYGALEHVRSLKA